MFGVHNFSKDLNLFCPKTFIAFKKSTLYGIFSPHFGLSKED